MKKIPSFVWILLTVILGAGFLALLSNQKGNNNIEAVSLPVEVEVYSDYNCPHCADFVPFVQDVKETYGEKVRVSEKHLPFLSDSSYDYANAAEAAREQDRFEEYNLALFKWISYQRNPSNTTFEYSDEEKTFYSQQVDTAALAQNLGLNVEKFQSDLSSQTIINRVLQQKTDIVKALGTQSTPTVMIYGQQFNMTNFEDLKTKVGELITMAESKTAE